MGTTADRGCSPDDLRPHGGADAFLRDCPARTTLEVISNKWVFLVLGALRDDGSRFGQLRRRLDGITQKMLTQTLRELERNGLVTRLVQPTVPPRVDYRLTDLGHSVNTLFDGIRFWSEQHVEEIVAARARYDERPDDGAEPPEDGRIPA